VGAVVHTCHSHATGKAEIRRNMVPGQPKPKMFAKSHLSGKKLDVIVHPTLIPATVGSIK
jgi:hypothetical protein